MATKARITKPEHVHTRKAHAFQVGMKLEVVDRRNPQLIRPATIMDLIDFDVKVLYDGWPEGYAYWLSDDHPDMHPVNWCARTGHPLEPPPSPQCEYDQHSESAPNSYLLVHCLTEFFLLYPQITTNRVAAVRSAAAASEMPTIRTPPRTSPTTTVRTL